MPQIYAGQRVTAALLSTTYSIADNGAVTVTQASATDLTGTYTVPANDAVTDNEYEVEAWGNGTWGSTAQSLTFQIVFGGNTMASFPLGANYMATSTAFRWWVSGRVHCQTAGASGVFTSLLRGIVSISGSSLLTSGGSSANATNAEVNCESTGTTSIDTTAAQGLKIQALWASTTGAPTITKRRAIQRKLGIG